MIKINFSPLYILNNRKEYLEREITVITSHDKKSAQYFLVEKLIEDLDKEPYGAILLLKEIKKVYRLIGNFIGANTRYNFSSIIGNNAKLKKEINLTKAALMSSYG